MEITQGYARLPKRIYAVEKCRFFHFLRLRKMKSVYKKNSFAGFAIIFAGAKSLVCFKEFGALPEVGERRLRIAQVQAVI